MKFIIFLFIYLQSVWCLNVIRQNQTQNTINSTTEKINLFISNKQAIPSFCQSENFYLLTKGIERGLNITSFYDKKINKLKNINEMLVNEYCQKCCTLQNHTEIILLDIYKKLVIKQNYEKCDLFFCEKLKCDSNNLTIFNDNTSLSVTDYYKITNELINNDKDNQNNDINVQHLIENLINLVNETYDLKKFNEIILFMQSKNQSKYRKYNYMLIKHLLYLFTLNNIYNVQQIKDFYTICKYYTNSFKRTTMIDDVTKLKIIIKFQIINNYVLNQTDFNQINTILTEIYQYDQNFSFVLLDNVIIKYIDQFDQIIENLKYIRFKFYVIEKVYKMYIRNFVKNDLAFKFALQLKQFFKEELYIELSDKEQKILDELKSKLPKCLRNIIFVQNICLQASDMETNIRVILNDFEPYLSLQVYNNSIYKLFLDDNNDSLLGARKILTFHKSKHSTNKSEQFQVVALDNDLCAIYQKLYFVNYHHKYLYAAKIDKYRNEKIHLWNFEPCITKSFGTVETILKL